MDIRWEQATWDCPLWEGDENPPYHEILQEEQWDGREWELTGREKCLTCLPLAIETREGWSMKASRIFFSDGHPHRELVLEVLRRVQLFDKKVRWRERAACYCHKKAEPSCQDPTHDLSGYLVLGHRGWEIHVDPGGGILI